jgi:glutaredoxin 2
VGQDQYCAGLGLIAVVCRSPAAINGTLSFDDIRVLPLLRSAAVVKGLKFPRKVRDYFETMMKHIGYQPLPGA